MRTSEVFIGGQWRLPASGETYATIHPATEEVSAHVAKGDELDIDRPRRAPATPSAKAPGPGWPRPSGLARRGDSPP
jgi:acyl-CoA reductase-like NAD-dependent aldehyde dehydrogenase